MDKSLSSKTIYFRAIEVADASFVLDLRTDKTYNRHLSTVADDLSLQQQWIHDYKARESKKEEYYFIVHRQDDDEAIGTVRLYDFVREENSFCWGSWILNENKTRYAAIECALMIYDFAFDTLGFARCHMDIRKENEGVTRFHKRMGVKIVRETEADLIGHYFKKDYHSVRPDLIKLIDSSLT